MATGNAIQSAAAAASGPPTGAAGGDLAGTYPNPTLAVPPFAGYNVSMTSYGLALATAVPQAATSSQVATNQVFYAGRCTAYKTQTISTLGLWVIIAGVTPGAGANRLAIFNATGTLLQQTGDMTTTFESIGFAEGSITAQQVTAGTDYWLAALTSYTGTTVTFGRVTGGGSIPALNGINTCGNLTAQASIPASFNPASLNASGASPMMYGR